MIGVYIRPPSMTVEQYKMIDEKIRTSGVSDQGLKLHTCFGEGEGVAIFDVWESKEEFEAFSSQLGTIVAELGIPMAPPAFVEMIAFDAR